MTHTTARQHWMSVLARARLEELEAYYTGLDAVPEYQLLRPAEIGLAMVRGRMGGSGDPFSFAEMTLSRCVVQTARGTRGFGYVAGRNRRHAELAALFDALLQEEPSHQATLIAPLHGAWQAQRMETARKAEATRVNFMTMVRGD